MQSSFWEIKHELTYTVQAAETTIHVDLKLFENLCKKIQEFM